MSCSDVDVKHGVRWIGLGVGIVVVALAVVLALTVGSDPQAELDSSALVGKPVPKFALTDMEGTSISNLDIAGRVTIVNFWNTWCSPCRDELPALQRFAAAHETDNDVEMLGIVRDAREPERVIKQYVDAEQMSWTTAMDDDARVALAFGTRGQPETFVISPSGMVVGARFGPVSNRDLELMLEVARAAGR